jgi:hypothetical protein
MFGMYINDGSQACIDRYQQLYLASKQALGRNPRSMLVHRYQPALFMDYTLTY